MPEPLGLTASRPKRHFFLSKFCEFRLSFANDDTQIAYDADFAPGAIILFATEKLPVDMIGILLVMGLVLTRVLNVQDAVAGFGNDIIITIGGLFILVGGLIKTGMVDVIGRRMHRIAGRQRVCAYGFDNDAAAAAPPC